MASSSSTVLSPTGRLLPTVTPTHYDLHYTSIDLDRHTFAGTVTIDVDVHPAPAIRDAVILHCLEVSVLSATFQPVVASSGSRDDGGNNENDQKAAKAVEAYEFNYSIPTQTYTIQFPSDTIQPSTRGKLTIQFLGTLNDLMHGLYRSSYTSLDGRTLTIATTQFEPVDARRAFPCFDEPALKATFRLKVTIDVDPSRPGLRCFSNTEIVSERTTTSANNKMQRTYTFAPTPKMSTYLLALIVSEFDAISQTPTSGHTSGVTTTVYAVPGKAHQGQFCLEVASKALELFSDLFGVDYPLGKSDLVAVPDFAAGAMENWGLVTYREAKILVKEGSTSETMKRGIARTVCHELAHQWFGNLVTMEFWTQLWLKEGVARFVEFVAIDRIFPEWDAWTEFTQTAYGMGLGLDAMLSSHPVEVDVKSSDEIGEIFDSISYAKGASIIRMVSAYTGFEAFLRGMRLYLQRYQYGNATSEMLWQALEDESNLPVVKLALPWTLQTGYPLVQLPEGRDGGEKIRTPRYLAGGPTSGGDDAAATVWPIPITALVEGEEGVQGPWVINGPSGDESEALREKIAEWTQAGRWFKLNASQTGFFRIAYTEGQWDKLSEVMSPSGPLSATDRLGLLSDSFAVGRAGYASIVDSLKLVQKFGEHEESEYAVWQELSENLAGLASLYRSTTFFPHFQQYVARIYAKQMARLGWDAQPGESDRTGTLRGTIINMMGIAGDEAVLAEALRRFRLYAENPVENPIPGDLQGVIFRTALRHDEEFVYTELKRIYEKSSFPEEQRNCLSTMGRVKDMARHAKMLDYTLFSGKVRFQDMAFPLNGLSSGTDEGGRACWKKLKSDFDCIASKYRSSHVVWGALVGLSCRGLKTVEEADEVEAFFQDPDHPCGSAKRRLSQALEVVRTKAARLDRDCAAVSKFFEDMFCT